MAAEVARRSKRIPKPKHRYIDIVEPAKITKRKTKNHLVVSELVTPNQLEQTSGTSIQKGRICTRQELRPKLIKEGVTFAINCEEMEESGLADFNLTVADLDQFLKENMKIKKGNHVTTEKLGWNLMVHCKKVTNTKDGFNKAYLKLLLKRYLWIRHIRDWVHVEANLPTTLKLLYFRATE